MASLEAKNIHKTFLSGELKVEILKGISLVIEPGDFVAITGKSGAGKSTLLYQLSALDKPTSGEIYIQNQNVTDMSESDLEDFRLHTLGYIFQDYALIQELTALDNIQLPLLMAGMKKSEAKAAALAMLETVDLSNKEDNYPSQLSGGEQQRVSIARAVVGKPNILFADEPTANLDSKSGARVMELITNLNRDHGQTIVMVTHEAEYAEMCNRIIDMEDGLIVSDRRLHQDQNY